ncbi:beta family protein [Paraburkholderia xenovorans]
MSKPILPRVELDLFNRVNAGAVQTSIWFADYTILPPSVVKLDWRLISRVMTPKALYTSGDSWLVVRLSAFSSPPDGYAQYYDIAGELLRWTSTRAKAIALQTITSRGALFAWANPAVRPRGSLPALTITW